MKLISLQPVPLSPVMADRVRSGLSLTICCLLRNCRPWMGFLQEVVSYLRDAGADVRMVLVEDGSSDGTDNIACQMLASLPGSFIKFGRNPEFSSLSVCEKLAQLRNAALEHCLRIRSDWTMFLDSNIYFRLSTPLEMIDEAGALAIDGLLTPFTLGSYVRFRAGRYLAVKPRNHLEQHYFDTFALRLNGGRSTYPACPFSTCRKCRRGTLDRYATKALRVESAFAGLGLIETSTLLKTGAKWPAHRIGGECEHVGFCRQLREASPGCTVHILTQVDAFCDRTT